MAFLGSNNALAWVHFRLRGGWVRSFTFTAAILLVIAAIIITMHRLHPDGADRILFGWTTGLLAVQAAVLILYIPGRISTIIRAETQSKMIESHRLMPLPPSHAVAGYIMGAATQPLVFCGGMFVLGALVAGAAGVHVPRWTFANAVLLAFAAFAWVVSAYTSFGGRAGGGIFTLMIFLPYMSQGFALVLVPGLTVLLSPVIGQSVFDLRSTGATLPAPYAVAFAAQIYFGLLCFIGAARAYRSTVEVSLDTILGLCFLLGWVAMSFAALRAWEDFRPRGWNPGRVSRDVQVVASLLAAMLIALAPLAANARQRIRWRRHAALRDPYPIRRPPPIAAVIAIAVLAILAIPFAPTDLPTPPSPGVMVRTAAIVTVALVGLYFFFDWAYAWTKSVGLAAALWIVFTWVGPIAMDLAHHRMSGSGETVFGRFAPASPAGALILLWTGGDDVDVRIGLAVQILFALIPMCAWLITSFRGRRVRLD